MKARYINPFTDFGFKKIFGEEASKPQLIDFLNALLPLQNKITNLSFKNPAQLGTTDFDRKAIYDIYCESEAGEKFIVELQKAKQDYFIDRTVFYSTFPIREQADKGEWNYLLKAVYCVGILDFAFTDYKNETEQKEVVHMVALKDQNCRLFYDKLAYVYLEMPNFLKTEAELKTRLDKWLYFLKHLEDFQHIPLIFKEDVFVGAFEKAELARMSPAEQDSYEYSLKVFRDNKAVYDYAINTARTEAREEGRQEGREEGREEGIERGEKEKSKDVARLMIAEGEPIKKIIRYTGLSKEEIEALY